MPEEESKAQKAAETAKDAAAIAKVVASDGTDVVDDIRAAGALMKWVPKICACSFLFYASLFAMLLFFIYMAGVGGSVSDSNSNQLAKACGQKTTAQEPPTPTSCSGLTSKAPSSNTFYHLTSFGCNDGFPKDPGDNCIAACPRLKTVTKQSGPVNVDGSRYEYSVEWYSANADEYGCNATLKVTNPSSGQAVIVKAIDRGPNCRVMTKGIKFDVSQATSKALGGPNVVKVEKVADDTPIGPVTSCSAKGGINDIVYDLKKIITKAELSS